jgi:hypothetical protein
LGALSHLLRNRFLIGEVKYKSEVLPGEQPAILDKSLFEAVQQKLSAHQSHKTLTRLKSNHLLKDLLFDDAGHRMIATHATKAGIRYRYYVSQPGLHGEARTATLGSVSRVPATEIEQVIVSGLQKHITEQDSGASDCDDPIERRLRLISAIARGRRWLEEIVTGSITDAEQLAKRERCSVRQINLTLAPHAESQLPEFGWGSSVVQFSPATNQTSERVTNLARCFATR